MTDTTYTIQMASKISGVGVHTIRAWEKRYKALAPERDASGHRTYTKGDVEKLMLLSELCLLGYAISKVASLSTPELKDQLKNLGKTEESLENQDFSLIHDTRPVIDPAQSLPILNFALKTYNIDVINVELGKLKTMLSVNDFTLKILSPLCETLNEIVRNGAYQSHQEMGIKALMKFHMGFELYHPSLKKEKSSVNVVIAGLENATDDLTLDCAGLLCHHYGYHYIYLGHNIQIDSLVDIVKSLQMNLIVVRGDNRSTLEKIINKVGEDINIATLSNRDAATMPSKRLAYLKDLDAVDRYFNNYLSKS